MSIQEFESTFRKLLNEDRKKAAKFLHNQAWVILKDLGNADESALDLLEELSEEL